MFNFAHGCRNLGLALSLSLLVWGCSSEVETDDLAQSDGKGDLDLMGSEPTDEYSSIIFNKDGAPEVSGDLIAGKKIKVFYDYNRLFKDNPGCSCADDEYKNYLPNGSHPEIRMQYILANDYLYTAEAAGISNIFALAPKFSTIDTNKVKQPFSLWFFCIDHAATSKAKDAVIARQSPETVKGKSGQTTLAYLNATITTEDCCRARDPNYQGGGCGSVVAGSAKSNVCIVYDSNDGKNYQFELIAAE